MRYFRHELHYVFKSVKKIYANHPVIRSFFEDHCALFFTNAKFQENLTEVSKSVVRPYILHVWQVFQVFFILYKQVAQWAGFKS